MSKNEKIEKISYTNDLKEYSYASKCKHNQVDSPMQDENTGHVLNQTGSSHARIGEHFMTSPVL